MGGVGLDAFVAKDAASFVRIGLSWAGDPGALADIRSGLRARLQRSAIHRPEVIAAGLENALRTMWRRWCAGLPPESFAADAPATNRESK
jgi:predicted O-linked N-acetylglucosamine transferase (SPINDLY family)